MTFKYKRPFQDGMAGEPTQIEEDRNNDSND